MDLYICRNQICVPSSYLFLKVKDVRLPQNLQRAMAAEAEATREARAKVTNIFHQRKTLAKPSS